MKQILYYIVTLLVGLALGYYLMPKKEIVKTVEKQIDRVVTIVTHPDGTIEKVITDKSKINTNESTKLNVSRSKYSLSLLAGTDFSTPTKFGIHANKEFIGPITLGIFGLTNTALNNGTIGLSVGLNF